LEGYLCCTSVTTTVVIKVSQNSRGIPADTIDIGWARLGAAKCQQLLLVFSTSTDLMASKRHAGVFAETICTDAARIVAITEVLKSILML